MAREFDYTIVETSQTRVVIDWVLNRAYDVSTWASVDVLRFKDANLVQRMSMLSDATQCALDSWVVDCNPWETF